MKVVLHIGTEKTGTSTLQETLYLNRELLHQHGCHLLQSANKKNARLVPAYCLSDDHYDDFYENHHWLTIEEKNHFKESFKNMLL